MRKKKILIVGGDPNSINSEIIIKCWRKLNKSLRQRIYIISNYKLINQQLKKLSYSHQIVKINDINTNFKSDKLKIIDIDLNFKDPFRVPKITSSKFVLKSLDLAHSILISNKAQAMINCAIDKNLFKTKKTGVTEYLAMKCKIKDKSEVMLIFNEKLSVCPITTHIDLKQVPSSLKINLLIKKIKKIDSWYMSTFKKRPKIGVLGLNPHNAEHRKFSEEEKIIKPSIKKLNRLKLNISGPFPSDTIFMQEYKKYDVIVGMYHDQVLAPFKTLFKYDAINITLGLKYLRASPDHGIAENLIGKKKANATSLLKCINFIKLHGK